MNAQRTAGSSGDPPAGIHKRVTSKSEFSSAAPSSESQSIRYLKTRYYALIAAVAVLFFFIGLFAGLSGRGVPFAFSPDAPTMTQCMSDTQTVLDLKQPLTPVVLRQLVEHCYSLLRSQELLKDFAIRKLNFIQQYHANGILMWMVVVITISGVLLAGLQLFASYRLAEAKKKSLATSDEISLRRDQIVLKSSVTGLFILLLSFAFFLVFVLYVYRFEKSEDDGFQKPQQGPTLPLGGLGPPPTRPTQ